MDNKKIRYCTIQVDIDGLWAVKKLMGQDVSIDPDPVFELGTDRLLHLFNEFDIKATFFVVARDLESKNKMGIVRKISEAGHEIASHGMSHSYLNAISESERRYELVSSKKFLEDTLEVKIRGFKAPGFVLDKDAARRLCDSGYEYDSSVLGTSLAYLMELFSGLSYSKWDMMTAPSGPYRSSRDNIFKKGSDGIVEIPVTTMPFFRLPVHFSYATVGGAYYARFTQAMVKSADPKFVNYLFHPLDLLDKDSIKSDVKIYGLKVKAGTKLAMARAMLAFFKKRYTFLTSGQLSDILKSVL